MGVIFFALDFTSAVTCAPTGSMELVFRSLQKSRKVWTSGPVPSVPRLGAELKRRNCTVCVASRMMRESKICFGVWTLRSYCVDLMNVKICQHLSFCLCLVEVCECETFCCNVVLRSAITRIGLPRRKLTNPNINWEQQTCGFLMWRQVMGVRLIWIHKHYFLCAIYILRGPVNYHNQNFHLKK